MNNYRFVLNCESYQLLNNTYEMDNLPVDNISNDVLNNDIKPMSLGTRMKLYEQNEIIPPYQSFIIRSDGKGFSKYTSMLQKPFDNNFQTAIVHTANELLNFFNARSVFCCSDEISLVFSSVCSREEYEKLIASNEKNLPVHIYSGRRSKLESLISDSFYHDRQI